MIIQSLILILWGALALVGSASIIARLPDHYSGTGRMFISTMLLVWCFVILTTVVTVVPVIWVL